MFESPTVQQVNDRICTILGDKRGIFRPLAYFDKHMDSIRVELRDCSVREYRINEILTIHLDTDPEAGQSEVVGLTVKGVRHLFTESGLPLDGVVRLTQILDYIANVAPNVIEDVGRKELLKDALKTVVDFARYTELSVDLRATSNELAIAA